MIISIIAAVAQNQVVGNKGRMPWKCPEEMKFFKEKTLDHPVIMGRKTWDSLYVKPLPRRHNIVITRNQELIENGCTDDVTFINNLEGALDLVYADTNECFIIGGTEIWKYALDMGYVERMYVNVMNKDYEGDAHFPYYDEKEWIVEPSKQTYNDFKSYTIIKKPEQV